MREKERKYKKISFSLALPTRVLLHSGLLLIGCSLFRLLLELEKYEVLCPARAAQLGGYLEYHLGTLLLITVAAMSVERLARRHGHKK